MKKFLLFLCTFGLMCLDFQHIEASSKAKKPWYKRAARTFADFPSFQATNLSNPERLSDILWFLPNKEKTPPAGIGEAIGNVMVNAIVRIFYFDIMMRAINMALAAVASIIGFSYHAFLKTRDKDKMFHFSKILMYDALLALAAQGAAFKLENFIEYFHQKLIAKYPFFRTYKGDLLFKSIGWTVKTAFPLAVFYSHIKLAKPYKELKIS